MTILIRPLAGDDVEKVVAFSLRAWAPVFASFEAVLGEEIYRRVYPDWLASQARDIAQTCRDLVDTTWVAEADGRPVGFVAAVPGPDHASADIEMIAVDPDHQRRGIAAELLEYACDRMRAGGATVIGVVTGGDPGHEAARRTYEKAGFTALPLVRYYRAEPAVRAAG